MQLKFKLKSTNGAAWPQMNKRPVKCPFQQMMVQTEEVNEWTYVPSPNSKKDSHAWCWQLVAWLASSLCTPWLTGSMCS